MEISDVEQEISDITWFAIDAGHNIASMSSNGGRLPLSVASSAEDNSTLVDYFNSLNVAENAFVINENFQVPILFHGIEQQKIFFHTFSLQSARGLYSFSRNEKDTEGIWSDKEYSLISIPTNPIVVTALPDHIQTILGKTVYDGLFKNVDIINISNIK